MIDSSDHYFVNISLYEQGTRNDKDQSGVPT